LKGKQKKNNIYGESGRSTAQNETKQKERLVSRRLMTEGAGQT
jgi:hypothetical protein